MVAFFIKKKVGHIKVLYISQGCCTELEIYYFILYLFLAIGCFAFKLMMLVKSGIFLKNHISCKLC